MNTRDRLASALADLVGDSVLDRGDPCSWVDALVEPSLTPVLADYLYEHGIELARVHREPSRRDVGNSVVRVGDNAVHVW